MSQSYIRYLQAPIEYMMVQTKYVELSGQIIIFHQPFPPGFPWNKGTFLSYILGEVVWGRYNFTRTIGCFMLLDNPNHGLVHFSQGKACF